MQLGSVKGLPGSRGTREETRVNVCSCALESSDEGAHDGLLCFDRKFRMTEMDDAEPFAVGQLRGAAPFGLSVDHDVLATQP